MKSFITIWQSRCPRKFPIFPFWGLGLAVLGALLARTAWAVRPVSATLALVAGEGAAGYRDGKFTSAFFNKPMGLAVSPEGDRIYIADTGNNRIRVIHLDQAGQVTTLTGQDKPGDLDGPLAAAQFNQPRGVVCLPEERLVVNDFGNHLLRLVDLKSGRVSTLAMREASSPAGSALSTPTPAGTAVSNPVPVLQMEGIRDMAYLPLAGALIFSQPEKMTLKALDLKTGEVTVILNKQENLVHPSLLCVSGNKLYAADRDLNQVFEVGWKPGSPVGVAPVGVTSAKVLSLAGGGGTLYALQADIQVPLLNLLPQGHPVTFFSPWEGEIIKEPKNNLASFRSLNPAEVPGLAADPWDGNKLYIVNPYHNIVSTFREPQGGIFAGETNDFQFNPLKPPRTFRILLVGDSRSCMIVDNQFRPTPFSFGIFPRQLNLANRLMQELNAQAALDDAPADFEVLNQCHSASAPLFLWPFYEAPPVAQKYDVDLVLVLQPQTPFGVFPPEAYYTRPPTKEGIPAQRLDPEYLLKSPQDRIPPGEARRFFDLCKARKLVGFEGKNIVFSQSLKRDQYGMKVDKQTDPELFDSLVNLLGKPLGLLEKELSGMKTSSGSSVRLLLCYTPTATFRSCPEEAAIWEAAAEKYHLPFLDLSQEMTALRLSYYPMAETGGNDHFTLDGNVFFSRLLARCLIRDGLIPWNRNSPFLKASPSSSGR